MFGKIIGADDKPLERQTYFCNWQSSLNVVNAWSAETPQDQKKKRVPLSKYSAYPKWSHEIAHEWE